MADWKELDKDLVAEQPGLGLSLIGLFLAFFMGLAIRAAVAPERVQAHLHEAIQSIHQDLKFDFEKADVSFSQGFWPDLSVVVQNVRIESNNPCWLTPLAEINEIRLPLSFKHLFKGQILIHEILADEVNLSLRTPYQKCDLNEARSVSSEKEAVSKPAPVPVSTTQSASPDSSKAKDPQVMGNFENVPRDNPIDTVILSKLRIHYLPVAFTSAEIDNFQAFLKAEDPRWIQITGLLREPTADIQIDLHEGDSPNIAARFSGVWSEGQYNLQAKLDSKTQNFTFESNLKQLPLSRIIPILKKYRWVESEFNGKRAWISGQMKTAGPVSELAKTPFHFSNFKIEGDLGEISCTKAEIQSWQPLKFKPVEFQIRGLNIKEFLTFLNRPHPSPALGDLGLFNGTATFINPEEVRLRGDYSGLEFIFSNRGIRQVQALSLVSGELELRNNQWRIDVDRIRPVEGIFEGRVQIHADKNFKDLRLKANISELGLAPKVQSLMTNGGSLGALNGQIQAKLKSAQIIDLNAALKWDQLLIEGVRFQKPKATIQTINQEIKMQLAAQELEILPQSIAAPLFQPIFDNSKEDYWSLKSPTASIRTRKFQSLKWDQFLAQTSIGSLQSTGEWNERSELNGVLQLSGKNKKSWDIRGTRSQPQLVEKAL